MQANRALIEKTSTVSAATLGSRLLGFARDVGTAAVLGAGPLADAVMAALSLPLLARRLLAEGAFNAALLPALSRAEGKGQRAVANAAFASLTGLLAALTLAGALGMPALILLLAPGFTPGGARADLAVECGRIALLYLPLAGAAAVLGGIANAAGRVLLPALGPMVGNAVALLVIAWLLLEGHVATPLAAWAMAGCAVLAGLAQLALMIAAARGAPAALAPRAGFDWSAGRKVLRAAGPAFLFAGLPQMRILLVAAMVSATPGAVSALNYAQRLVDLPLGLVGASAGAVLVPLLAAGAGRAGARRAGAATMRAALAALAFALPAAAGLYVLAEPIISVLYQRGSFTPEDSARTAAMLAALALALPAQGLEKVLCAAAMSHGLTRGAERIGLVSLAAALVLAAPLALAFGPAAGALAVALSAVAAILGLARILWRAGHLPLDPRAARAAGILIAASLAMAGVVLTLAAWVPVAGGWQPLLRLGLLVAAGIAAYGSALFAARRVLAGSFAPPE